MPHIDIEKFKLGFLDEAADLLEEANENILRAESGGDLELFNAVFRCIHTIKGSAGGFGFDGISEFSHHLETMLDKLRTGELKINADITDLLLKGIDTLFEMVDYARDRKEYNKDLSGITAQFESRADDGMICAVEADADRLPEAVVKVDTAIKKELISRHPGFGKPYRVNVKFTDEMLENGYDPLTLYSNLRNISDVFIAVTDTEGIPETEQIEPYKLYLRPDIYIISDASLNEITDLAFDPDTVEVHEISLDDEAGQPESKTSMIMETDERPESHVATEGIDTEMLAELAAGIEDYFESIENYLIEIEKTGIGSKEAVDNIFRVFHNIKGDSGYVGFSFMEKYAHLVENMLDKVREGSVVFDNRAAEFILNIISDVKAVINALLNKEKPCLPETYTMLHDLTNTITLQVQNTPAITDEVKIFLGQVDQFMEMIELAESVPAGMQMRQRAAAGLRNAAKFIGFKDLTELAVAFESDVSRGKDYDAVLSSIKSYITQLKSPPKKLGELLVESGKVTVEEVEHAKSQQKKIGEILVDQGKLDKDELDMVLKKQNIMKASENTAPAAVVAEPEPSPEPVVAKEKFSQSMKVDQEKIDKFTNTIGELVVAKNAYEYMMQKLIKDYDLPTSLVKDFKDNSNLIARISQDLQRDILSLRMVPIKQIFNKFPVW